MVHWEDGESNRCGGDGKALVIYLYRLMPLKVCFSCTLGSFIIGHLGVCAPVYTCGDAILEVMSAQ